jgi:hypothetical protein
MAGLAASPELGVHPRAVEPVCGTVDAEVLEGLSEQSEVPVVISLAAATEEFANV